MELVSEIIVFVLAMPSTAFIWLSTSFRFSGHHLQQHVFIPVSIMTLDHLRKLTQRGGKVLATALGVLQGYFDERR